METETARGIRIAGLRARYDDACKRVLSDKIFLAHILKECVPEFKDCDIHDIETKYIEGTPEIGKEPVLPDDTKENSPLITGIGTEDKTVNEGTIYYDIRFKAYAPGTKEPIALIINVEAQKDFYPGYPLVKRGLFYCGRMLSAQYGREFTDNDYGKLKKVYSIWVCTEPPKYRANTITRYRVVEENLVGDVKEPAANYDVLSAVIICLGGPNEERYRGVLKMLDILLLNTCDYAAKEQMLEHEFGIQMSAEARKEVSEMCNLSQGVFDKGIAKGIAIGEARKETQSMLSSIRCIVEELGFSEEKAMATLRIPESERPKYRALLAQEA